MEGARLWESEEMSTESTGVPCLAFGYQTERTLGPCFSPAASPPNLTCLSLRTPLSFLCSPLLSGWKEMNQGTGQVGAEIREGLGRAQH